MNDYTSIILGAVAGYILPYIVKIVVYILKRWKTTSICGKWTAYLCWTKEDTVSIEKMDVAIKRGILKSKYKITKNLPVIVLRN